MKVVRTELLDFTLILTQQQFDSLREVSDKLGCSVENAVLASYLRGLSAMQQGFDIKE